MRRGLSPEGLQSLSPGDRRVCGHMWGAFLGVRVLGVQSSVVREWAPSHVLVGASPGMLGAGPE